MSGSIYMFKNSKNIFWVLKNKWIKIIKADLSKNGIPKKVYLVDNTTRNIYSHTHIRLIDLKSLKPVRKNADKKS